jgi:hypothetical protein
MSKFVDAKHRLMPYLYNLVRHSSIRILVPSDVIFAAADVSQT